MSGVETPDEETEIRIEVATEGLVLEDLLPETDAQQRVQEWAEAHAENADKLSEGCQDEPRVHFNADFDKRFDAPAASGDEGPDRAQPPNKRSWTKSKSKGKSSGVSSATRKWLRIGADGETTQIGASKYKMAHKLGVQPRDLRFLELPTLSFSPPALLARENAIVVCFERIRCIITLNYVLVVNPEDERVAGLIDDFNTQLRSGPSQLSKKGYPGVSKLSDVASKLRYGRTTVELPFELKVLEICFDKLVSELSSAASELEREALPALDILTKRIRIPDLEAVRRVKNKLVRLKTRIESIHEVLDKFLNDDEDMHRLNLTAEQLSRQASEAEHQQRSMALAAAAAEAAEAPAPDAHLVDTQQKVAGSVPGSITGSSATLSEAALAPPMERVSQAPLHGGSHSSSSFNSQDEAEVAEVEMLLEAYDMHLEHALSRLQTLDEYIQDTEDLVNTSLDQKRNELIACDVLLTSNSVAFGLMSTISAFMAMNIVPKYLQVEDNAFNIVAIVSTIGTYVLYLIFLVWAIRENIIVF